MAEIGKATAEFARAEAEAATKSASSNKALADAAKADLDAAIKTLNEEDAAKASTALSTTTEHKERLWKLQHYLLTKKKEARAVSHSIKHLERELQRLNKGNKGNKGKKAPKQK